MYCNVAQCNAMQCNVVWCSVISINVLLWMHVFIYANAHMFCKRAFPSILSCLAKPTCTCPMTWFPLWFSITDARTFRAVGLLSDDMPPGQSQRRLLLHSPWRSGDTQPADVYFLIGWSKDWPFSTVYDAIILTVFPLGCWWYRLLTTCEIPHVSIKHRKLIAVTPSGIDSLLFRWIEPLRQILMSSIISKYFKHDQTCDFWWTPRNKLKCLSRWCVQRFLSFTLAWGGNDPIWRSHFFQRGGSTTNDSIPPVAPRRRLGSPECSPRGASQSRQYPPRQAIRAEARGICCGPNHE